MADTTRSFGGRLSAAKPRHTITLAALGVSIGCIVVAGFVPAGSLADRLLTRAAYGIHLSVFVVWGVSWLQKWVRTRRDVVTAMNLRRRQEWLLRACITVIWAALVALYATGADVADWPHTTRVPVVSVFVVCVFTAMWLSGISRRRLPRPGSGSDATSVDRSG